MNGFPASKGSEVVRDLIAVIVENRDYLSEIDGAIGDGDHGINMAKGFNVCDEAIGDQHLSLSEALSLLGNTLLGSIGGSMGPLYGMLFLGMAEAVENRDAIDADAFAAMLDAGLDNVGSVSEAKVGDKSMMDTLVPAVTAFKAAQAEGASFRDALSRMTEAAEKGRDSTRDMVSRIGRSSRLGERSRGVLDAGATSSCLLLTRLAESATRLAG